MTDKQREALEAGQWKAGQSGNPSGRPAVKRTLTAALVEAMNSDGGIVDVIARAIIQNAANNPQFLSQLWDRTEGAVKQTTTYEVSDPKILEACGRILIDDIGTIKAAEWTVNTDGSLTVPAGQWSEVTAESVNQKLDTLQALVERRE